MKVKSELLFRDRRVLVLWCPDWPLVALGFGDDDLVAVVEKGVVVAASRAARSLGVAVGLRRREAESRCESLLVIARDASQEAGSFEPVVEAVSRLSPTFEITRPGLLSLMTRGPARYFGGEEALGSLVVEEALRFIGKGGGAPMPSCGVADGRFSATLAARCASSQVLVVPPGENADFLKPFSVSVMGRPDLAATLKRLGVYTLGDFAKLPRDSVTARFGSDAADCHALAGGEASEVLQLARLTEPFVCTTQVDPPAEAAEGALFAGKTLAIGLVELLSEKALQCTRLSITLETEHAETSKRSWRAEEGMGEGEIVERLRWQLSGWLSGGGGGERPTAGIAMIRLEVEEAVRFGEVQPGLWGGSSEVDRRAKRGLDRLSALLGQDAVTILVQRGGRSLADRTERVPWGKTASRPREVSLPWPGQLPAPAPTTICNPKIPLAVTDQRGSGVTVSGRGELSGSPAEVSLGNVIYRLAGWSGPWTLDEKWWDSRARHRQARFQFLTDDGCAYLCCVEEGRWWVEAVYD